MESLLLRKVNEEIWGYPWYWIRNSSLYGIVTLLVPFLALIMAKSIIVKGLCVAWMALATFIYIIYLSSPEKQNGTTRRLQYIAKAHKGKTIIPKYTSEVAFLKEIVPLDKVHPTGIIQYTWNRYGVLFRLYVPNETEGGLESFVPLVVSNFVNRIVEPQTLKVFAMNKYIQAPNIVNEVLEAMNDSRKSREEIVHLESIYKQLTETVTVPTKRHIYMLIGLGVFDSEEKAERSLTNILPSLNDGFMLTGVTGIRVIDPNEIALAYRRCMK